MNNYLPTTGLEGLSGCACGCKSETGLCGCGPTCSCGCNKTGSSSWGPADWLAVGVLLLLGWQMFAPPKYLIKGEPT